MRERKILTYTKDNGQRTCLSLSEKQLEILERLAKFHGFNSKTKYVQFLLTGIKKENVSSYLRDIMLGDLLGIVKMMGVNI